LVELRRNSWLPILEATIATPMNIVPLPFCLFPNGPGDPIERRQLSLSASRGEFESLFRPAGGRSAPTSTGGPNDWLSSTIAHMVVNGAGIGRSGGGFFPAGGAPLSLELLPYVSIGSPVYSQKATPRRCCQHGRMKVKRSIGGTGEEGKAGGVDVCVHAMIERDLQHRSAGCRIMSWVPGPLPNIAVSA
jgi:hypothetical protein